MYIWKVRGSVVIVHRDKELKISLPCHYMCLIRAPIEFAFKKT